MDCTRIVYTIIGFSASFFLCLRSIKKWWRQKITAEKLRMIKEALEEAEERFLRFQDRHDRILGQICSHYLTNQELEEALAMARAHMNEALEFADSLRRMQMKIISSYPDEVDVSTFADENR